MHYNRENEEGIMKVFRNVKNYVTLAVAAKKGKTIYTNADGSYTIIVNS
jgi:hypothetical protein